MIQRQLKDMVGGWLVGDFEPNCFRSEACEVACKQYEAGAAEDAHVHRIATEITLIASGCAVMNGRVLRAGDILILSPGEAADFRAIEATTTVVVKLPSVRGDKYPVEPTPANGTFQGAPKVSRISCVLFDLDGVLVDATEWHYNALNRALHLFGFDITRYEHLSGYNGLPTRRKLEMLSVEKGLPAPLHGMLNRLKQVYTREEVLTRCRPVFEKEYMLSRLRREGCVMGVCSNSIRETLELMVGHSGLAEYFNLLVSNEDVVRPKPDPEIYMTAMARLGVGPHDTLIVEDAPHGVEAARRSGAHVCQVSGFGDVEYFRIREAIQRADLGTDGWSRMRAA